MEPVPKRNHRKPFVLHFFGKIVAAFFDSRRIAWWR
jgi:hypothetical protein